jgi:hypothetical protein
LTRVNRTNTGGADLQQRLFAAFPKIGLQLSRFLLKEGPTISVGR